MLAVFGQEAIVAQLTMMCMAKSRRDFLTGASVLMAAASACNDAKQKSGAEVPPAKGAPPAFGTSPEVGPPVSMTTFAEEHSSSGAHSADAAPPVPRKT